MTVREWKLQGRYEWWGVDEYHPDEPGHGTYGSPLNFRTKKDATAVVGALNTAYAHGRKDLAAELASAPTVPVDGAAGYLSLLINGVNAAFDDGNGAAEYARILRNLADRLEQGEVSGEGLLRDVNGNTVGHYRVNPGA